MHASIGTCLLLAMMASQVLRQEQHAQLDFISVTIKICMYFDLHTQDPGGPDHFQSSTHR